MRTPTGAGWFVVALYVACLLLSTWGVMSGNIALVLAGLAALVIAIQIAES